MKKSEIAIITLAVGLLASGSAMAQFINLGDLLGNLFNSLGHPKRAPAPLLAAGLPALMAVGGGAIGTKIIRRLRGKKPSPSA